MDGELSTLLDLATKQGVSYKTITSSVEEAVSTTYRKRYKTTQPVQILLDTATDSVRIMSDKKDITPEDFSEEAASIARTTILKLITSSKPSPESVYEEKQDHHIAVPTKSILSIGGKLLFWGYNILYLLYAAMFVISFLNEDVRDSLARLFVQSNTHTALMISLLLAYPIIFLYVAIKHHIRESRKLMSLFFLLELPMVCLTLVSLVIMRSPAPGVSFLTLLIIMLPPILYIVKHTTPKTEKEKLLLTVVTTIGAVTAIYIAVLVSFLIPPLVGMFFYTVTDFLGSLYDIFDVIYIAIFGIFWLFFVLAIAGLVSLPFILAYRLIVTLFPMYQNSAFTHARLVINLSIGVFIVLLAVSSYQPSVTKDLETLQAFSEAKTFDEKQEHAEKLLNHEQQLKTAMEDATNARSRYLFVSSDEAIADIYIQILNVPKPLAQVVQTVFDTVAAPIVYRGPTNVSGKLSNAYYELFGKYPYQNEPYYNQRDRYDPKNVTVTTRDIEVIPTDDKYVATVTITEEYETNSSRSEEVLYEFSLPTNAVVSDLRLGPELEHIGIIAPRNAAETVYQQEVNKSRDPALLEQTGPSQWRLRVFPIPGRTDTTTLGGKPQRVQFSYVTALQEDGYGLPNYTKTTNVNDPYSVSITLDGDVVSSSDNKTYVVPASYVDLCSPIKSKSIDLAIASSSARLAHVNGLDDADQVPCPPKIDTSYTDAHIALMFDVSRDQNVYQAEKEYDTLRESLGSSSVDLYRFNSMTGSPEPLENASDDLVFFGTSDPVQAINKLEKSYDAVFVITGASSIPATKVTNKDIDYPIYIVHTKELPPYPQDLTALVVSSGGTSSDSAEEVFGLFAAQYQNKDKSYSAQSPYVGIVVSPDKFPDTNVITNDPYSILTARALAVQDMMRNRALLGQTNYLDKLHTFASQNRITTPYSSFIALVNEQQMRKLEELSKQYNRYRDDDSFVPDGPMPIMLEQPAGAISSPLRMFGAPSTKTLYSPGAMEDYDSVSFNAAPGALTSMPSVSSGPVGLFALFNIALVILGIGMAALTYIVKRVRRKRKK